MIKYEIPNLGKALKALAKSPVRFRDSANRAIRRSIYVIQATAIPLTPIDTGALRQSEIKGTSFRDFYGEIFPNIEYAIFVHEGTYKMRARPFLKNAMDIESGNIERIFGEELEKSLEEIVKEAR